MKVKILRRYTNIPALIYLLRHKSLTLLDPTFWDDKNDSYFLQLYKEQKNLKTVLALCFAQAAEHYHHWHVFAGGTSGVCIQFDREILLDTVKSHAGIVAEAVQYMKLQDIHKKRLKVEDLPFLKRYPYQDEREFRLLYESRTKTLSAFDVPVPLSCIDRITLNPWIVETLADDLRDTILSIPDCVHLKVVRSTLISNERWKNAGESASSRSSKT
jgi:hypothetical protein